MVLRRFWVALLLLGLVVPAWTEARVTFQTPGERVAVLLTELSPQFGQPLACTKSVAEDVVAIRFQDVPAKLAMDRIAEVLHSTWRKEYGKLFLTRTDAQDRQQREAERATAIADMRQAQAQVASQLAEMGPFDAASAKKLSDDLSAHMANRPTGPAMNSAYLREDRDLEARSPLGRGISRLRLAISAEQLVDLPLGIRVVYSTNPTRLQRPLPADAAKVVQQIASDLEAWAAVAVPSQGRRMGGPINSLELFHSSFSESPTRALLIVSRFSRDSDTRFELLLANDKGHVLARGSQTLPSRRSGVFDVPVPPNDTPLVVSDEVQSIATMTRTTSLPTTGSLADVVDRLKNPDRFDPLSLAIGPGLIAAAEARHENLVALMSDPLWDLGTLVSNPKGVTVGHFLNQLRTRAMVNEVAGWLSVQPITPAQDRDTQVDRLKLAKFVKQRVTDPKFTIEQSAEWALSLPRTNENALPRTYTRILMGVGAGPDNNEDLLRMYGGMSPGQRTAALGDGVTIGSLSDESRAELNRMIFGFGPSVTMDLVLSSGNPVDFAAMNGLGREPTEMFANGFPEGSRLKMSEKTGFVAVSPGDGAMPTRYFTADQLASVIARQSRTDLFPSAARDGSILEHLSMGQSRELSFIIDFGPTIHLHPGALMDVSRSGADHTAYADLPAEFRAEVDRAVAVYKERYSRMRPGFGLPGRSTPPPR